MTRAYKPAPDPIDRSTRWIMIIWLLALGPMALLPAGAWGQSSQMGALPMPATANCTTRTNENDVGLSVHIDAVRQVAGNRQARLVDNTWVVAGWRDIPDYGPQWIHRRHEGVITQVADWFGLSGDLANPSDAWCRDAQGRIVFEPNSLIEQRIDEWIMRSGVRPMIVMGTPTIPLPLIEGEFRTGEYGYNVRQPNDYEAWRYYLLTLVEWLIARYGREQVASWGFMFGIESDWQTKSVYPGTDQIMNVEENRREFIKMVDYFHAALEQCLGPGVYTGVYFALEMQADDYLEHWAQGTNFATGQIGTRIAFCGVSDWVMYSLGDSFSPWEAHGANKVHPLAANYALAAGLVRKLRYLEERIAQYPQLRHLEICLPETGYIAPDPAGGPNPAEMGFADHRGAALHALRMIAYAESPALRWAFNRFSLGTGDQEFVFADKNKAPSFQLMRLQRDMAEERLLLAQINGRPSNARNEVRAMATAMDGTSSGLRVLIANFNDDLEVSTSETVRLRIKGLPSSSPVEVRVFCIDEQRNNWWASWRTWREANGIPYVARPTSQWKPPLEPSMLPLANNVPSTMRDEDLPRYLKWCHDNQTLMGWRPSETFGALTDAAGQLELRRAIAGHGVLYLEVLQLSAAQRHGIDLMNAGLWPTSGETRGTWIRLEQTSFSTILRPPPMGPVLRCQPGHPGKLSTRVMGLPPGRACILRVLARSAGRRVSYGAWLEPAGDRTRRVEGWGDSSGDWNRIVITAEADASGMIEVGLTAPDAPMGIGVEFGEIELLTYPPSP